MKEHFTYSFASPMTRDAMWMLLDELGPWKWDVDPIIDKLQAVDARGATLKIADASTSQRKLVIDFASEAPRASAAFFEILDTVFKTILPALEHRLATAPDAAADMVHVPGGRFLLGLTVEEADALARELATMDVTLRYERDELPEVSEAAIAEACKKRRSALEVAMPAHEVEVGEFYISRYPVTVGEYAQYIEKTGAPIPETWQLRRPTPHTFVTGVSWREASEFASYHDASLPTEIEWERAARSGRSFFPWGDSYFPLGRIAFPETGSSYAWEVGSRPKLASIYGVQDLIGEFGEFTSDPFTPYPGADVAKIERWYPHWRKERAVRGGYDTLQDSTAVYRNGVEPDVRARWLKFRLVRRATR